jgi:hypothetical protein
MLRRGVVIDEQAIALSLALAAYSSVSQPRAATRLARRGQLFIHLVGLDLRQIMHCSLPSFLHEIG